MFRRHHLSAWCSQSSNNLVIRGVVDNELGVVRLVREF